MFKKAEAILEIVTIVLLLSLPLAGLYPPSRPFTRPFWDEIMAWAFGESEPEVFDLRVLLVGISDSDRLETAVVTVSATTMVVSGPTDPVGRLFAGDEVIFSANGRVGGVVRLAPTYTYTTSPTPTLTVQFPPPEIGEIEVLTLDVLPYAGVGPGCLNPAGGNTRKYTLNFERLREAARQEALDKGILELARANAIPLLEGMIREAFEEVGETAPHIIIVIPEPSAEESLPN